MTKYNKVDQKDNMKIIDVEEVTEEREKTQRILTTQPIKPKRGLLRRMSDVLIGPTGAKRIGEYIREDVILPKIKEIIADSISSAVNLALFQDTNYRAPNRSRHTWGDSAPTTRGTDYRSKFTEQAPPTTTRAVRRTRTTPFVENYLITDRNEAVEVLNTLCETADRYDNVSLANYYDMIGVQSAFTDHNFGWSIDNILTATIIPTQGAYVIKLPELEEI